MNKFFLTFIFLFMPLSFQAKADAGQAAIVGMLKNMKIDKKEILSMVKTLQAQGAITKDQAGEVLKQVNGMSEKDIQNLKGKAIEHVSTGKIPTLNKQQMNSLTPEQKKLYLEKSKEFKKKGFQLIDSPKK